MDFKIKKYSGCRICRGRNLVSFLHLPGLPLLDSCPIESGSKTAFTCDLDVYWCPDCGVVQTLHDVLAEGYYAEYSYTVSYSPLMRNFMQKLAINAWKRFNLEPGTRVLEIGSGDGEQLRYFKDMGAEVLGFEPSTYLAEAAMNKEIKTINELFSGKNVNKIPEDFRPVNVIMLFYTFDHLPDPLGFLKTAAKILEQKRGIVIIEVHDLEKIIRRNEVSLFCHEHSIYASLASMEKIFSLAGFKLIAADLVPGGECRGNSLLVAGALTRSTHPGIKIAENQSLEALSQKKTYLDFPPRVAKSHQKLFEHINGIKDKGGRVAGYGVSARSINTVLIAGLDKKHIDYICDKNPRLHGHLLPVSGIPIKSPEAIRQDGRKIDEVIVFNYGYIEEIRKCLADYLAKGGKVTSLLEYLTDEKK